jgi:hypothetical protein
MNIERCTNQNHTKMNVPVRFALRAVKLLIEKYQIAVVVVKNIRKIEKMEVIIVSTVEMT